MEIKTSLSEINAVAKFEVPLRKKKSSNGLNSICDSFFFQLFAQQSHSQGNTIFKMPVKLSLWFTLHRDHVSIRKDMSINFEL